MGCGCGGNVEAPALAGFGAVVGRRAGRVRTRQLQKAAAGGRSGVNTAARVAGAFFRAKRGIVLRDKGQRKAFDRRVVSLASAYRAQLKRLPDPLARMSATAHYVVRSLGGDSAEAAAAAAYVVGRATGKITASPRAYLRGQTSGGFTAGPVAGSAAGPAFPAFPGARPVPLRPAFPGPVFQGGMTYRPGPGAPAFPSPLARVRPAFQLPLRRAGSYAAEDESPEGTAATAPLRPRLPGLRPGVGLSMLRPPTQGADEAAVADEGEDDEGTPTGLATLRGSFGQNVRAERMSRMAEQVGRPAAGGVMARFRPGAGTEGEAEAGLDDGAGVDDGALDAEAAGFGAAGFGVVNVWDRWRSQGNMQRKIERLRDEIEQLKAAYAEAGSSKRKAKIQKMIDYRERRIEGFERGLQDKAARRKDQRAWLVQQTARFSGVDVYGAAAPVGASPFDQLKPHLLPLTAAALFSYLMVQSWRGGSRPAA